MHQYHPKMLAALIGAGALCAGLANAGTETVTLVRSTLENVTDTGGIPTDLWQYEGGAIETTAGVPIGYYTTSRRVTQSGTAAYNTAAVTTTLFFASATAGNAPNVVTLEGSWSYSSGNFAGSVSAASNKYHWLIGADAASTIPATGTSSLVLSWLGSNSLRLP